MNQSPTFAVLQIKAPISFKQLIAGLLALLFVCIHAVKCFHHHTEQTSKHSLAKAEVKPDASCAICDYHFTKEADAVTGFAIVQPLLTYLSVSHFYILPATTSIGLPGTDRGPPAIV